MHVLMDAMEAIEESIYAAQISVLLMHDGH